MMRQRTLFSRNNILNMDWVKERGLGDAEIGNPVGCPKCHAWGVGRFREIG